MPYQICNKKRQDKALFQGFFLHFLIGDPYSIVSLEVFNLDKCFFLLSFVCLHALYIFCSPLLSNRLHFYLSFMEKVAK